MGDLISAFRMNYSDLGAEDWSDKESIKHTQRMLGVDDDGLVGRKTCFAFYASIKEQFAIKHGLVVNDKNFRFDNTKSRKILPNMGVIHDTVTATAKKAYDALNGAVDSHGHKRPLSTNYIIDQDGVIYECNDILANHTVHAGALNEESVGIDMVNVLDPSFLNRPGRDIFNARSRVKEVPWSATVSKPKAAIDYTESQKDSLVRLCNFLSDWLRIDKRVMTDMTGYGEKVAGFDERFNGFCAHAQWSTKRWDGLFAIEHLMKNGYGEMK